MSVYGSAVNSLLRAALVGSVLTLANDAFSAGPRVLGDGEQPSDHRLGPLQDLDGYFPFSPPATREAWEKRAGVRVRAGDIVFIRTGRWARRAVKGPWDTDKASAGLHVSAVRWLKARDVAVVGSDVHAEMMPSPVAGVAYPVHQLLLIAMGVPMLDNCDLEVLSEAASLRKRWEFLLTAAPLVVPLGTGAPLNPVATF